MVSVPLDPEESEFKLLGLSWNPVHDSFCFSLHPAEVVTTKRQLASQLARIFDPLGWLMPVTIWARAIFRSVCQESYEWDQPLPGAVQVEWARFAAQLPSLADIRIPSSELILVGFADASERAYAAVVYLVARTDSASTVSLLISKARMAPMKPLTLPRLELCAAHLLSKTMKAVIPELPHLPSGNIVALSDSTIALAWITAEPTPVWKVFVGNRVASIVENIPPRHWFHVGSWDNPADHASRGTLPAVLSSDHQWLKGPPWLAKPRTDWPLNSPRSSLSAPETVAEIRAKVVVNVMSPAQCELFEQLENRTSSLFKLQAIIARILRFSHNARFPDRRRGGMISTAERRSALLVLVRRAQEHALLSEIKDAKRERAKLHITRTLGLFMDTEVILRVGGRLRLANLPDDTRYPALLPGDQPLTTLIVRQAHEQNLHVGPSATHAFIRTKFWIPNGKNVVKRIITKCNRCFTIKPVPFSPPMGQLPAERTHPAPPFHTVPHSIKLATLKSARIVQMYLAIFICFTTKAVHIEVVSDASTPAFLEAYRRFVSRRGHPSVIWSDNGRNFIGAKRQLRTLSKLLQDQVHRAAVIEATARLSTEWHFIPPHAPHFGGLWEAGVKSMKRLLKTTICAQVPTFENFLTITTQVEAVLNSRPLTAESSSPDDLTALTPGHFLVHRPLTAPPMDNRLDEHTAHRSRWTMVQFIVQQFWKRWVKE